VRARVITGLPVRRFLYLSPYFPPQSRVGALRPLKFARHLPELGWAPVVLADLRASDAIDPALAAALPESTVVYRDYSRHAARAAAELSPDAGAAAGDGPEAKRRRGGLARALRDFDAYASRQPWYPRPEWLPLGAHSLDVPHALRAARRVLSEHPECEAILVNADPHAALLMGRVLSLQTELPLVCDLRDPWGPCELRRPLRPAPQRALEDRLERAVIDASAAYVLNTETACADYRAHYAEVSQWDPARFEFIRNSGDAALIGGGEFAPRPVFTVLMLGNLRRFVEGEVLLDTFAELRRRGHGPGTLRLLVSGELTREAREQAAGMGIEEMIETHPHVPYIRIGGFMDSADLLVSLSHGTGQRIPAKVYDYLTSDRPVLIYTDNAELIELVRPVEGVATVGLQDPVAGADRIEAELGRGRRRSVGRAPTGLDSRSASEKLAGILDRVTAR
jgi:hypothetical protein